MSSFGATLRLLRLESGMSLRDLARRMGVSSVYLSRVENGIDGVPTAERIQSIAGELGVAPRLLLDLAHRISPFVSSYVEQVPDAGSLFLELAHRNLGAAELAEVREFLDRRFPVARSVRQEERESLADLLCTDRVILQLTGTSMKDVLDVAAGRLALGKKKLSAPRIAQLLQTRERECSGAIGGGVWISSTSLDIQAPRVALITLARPLSVVTPDDVPIRIVITLVVPRQDPKRVLRLARVARLGARGLASELLAFTRPEPLIERLRQLEVWS